MKSGTGTAIYISPLTVQASQHCPETFKPLCLSPNSDKAPEQCPGTNGSQWGAAAQWLSKLGQLVADFPYYSTVAGSVSGQVELLPSGLILKEHQRVEVDRYE